MDKPTISNNINNRTRYDDSRILEVKKIYRELRQMREQHEVDLKLIHEENKKLIAIIGHDIKTPMSSIIGYLDILRDKITGLDRYEIERNVDIALISAKKTFTQLESLLEWATAEKQLKSFTQEEIDLKALLTEELENITLFASTKQITIELKDISREQVFIDKNMIRTVLRNLLNNAVKYTHTHGKIVITTKRNNDLIEVSIKDNGIGMKQEMQELIFLDYSYNSRLGTGNESGTGFGLLLCKEFIDINGGEIWIISEPGKGSEFKFTLPIFLDTN